MDKWHKMHQFVLKLPSVLQNVGNSGNKDLGCARTSRVIRQQEQNARVVFGPRTAHPTRTKRDSITGQVRTSTRAVYQLKQCLEYNYFLLLRPRSFIRTEQSILFLFNQSSTFVINNDLGSTFEAGRPLL